MKFRRVAILVTICLCCAPISSSIAQSNKLPDILGIELRTPIDDAQKKVISLNKNFKISRITPQTGFYESDFSVGFGAILYDSKGYDIEHIYVLAGSDGMITCISRGLTFVDDKRPLGSALVSQLASKYGKPIELIGTRSDNGITDLPDLPARLMWSYSETGQPKSEVDQSFFQDDDKKWIKQPIDGGLLTIDMIPKNISGWYQDGYDIMMWSTARYTDNKLCRCMAITLFDVGRTHKDITKRMNDANSKQQEQKKNEIEKGKKIETPL